MSSDVRMLNLRVRNFSGPGRPMTINETDDVLASAILRLSGTILGLVLGTVFALIIFVATNILVIKGGPVVGPHLSLLGQYFIGYTVTFVGSLIGSVYAFAMGFVSGVVIARVYNAVVLLRMGDRHKRQ
jgi:hypothetical protein